MVSALKNGKRRTGLRKVGGWWINCNIWNRGRCEKRLEDQVHRQMVVSDKAESWSKKSKEEACLECSRCICVSGKEWVRGRVLGDGIRKLTRLDHEMPVGHYLGFDFHPEKTRVQS